MRRLPTTNDEQEEDNVIGSAILSEQKGDYMEFPIPRKDYINALLNGDATIMKQLNVQGELKYTGAIDSSCSDTECFHTNPQCCQNPVETTTLPLFPMIKLKRRRVMYYIPIKFDDVEVDALVDTGACLSAIPLNVYNKILGLAGANILLCRERWCLTSKLQTAKHALCFSLL